MSSLSLTLKDQNGVTTHKESFSGTGFTVGQSDYCNLQINDPKLCPIELIIEKENDVYWILASKASSGFIFNQQIHKKLAVDSFSEINFHGYSLSLQVEVVSHNSLEEATRIVSTTSNKLVQENTVANSIGNEATRVVSSIDNEATRVVSSNFIPDAGKVHDEATQVTSIVDMQQQFPDIAQAKVDQSQWISDIKQSVKNTELLGFLDKAHIAAPQESELTPTDFLDKVRVLKREHIAASGLLVIGLLAFVLVKWSSSSESNELMEMPKLEPAATNVRLVPKPLKNKDIENIDNNPAPVVMEKEPDVCSQEEYIAAISRLFENN